MPLPTKFEIIIFASAILVALVVWKHVNAAAQPVSSGEASGPWVVPTIFTIPMETAVQSPLAPPVSSEAGGGPPGYTLLETIGGGTSGTVKRAKAPDGQEVAIKRLHNAASACIEKRALDRMKGLSRPGLVAIYDCRDDGDSLSVVMELCDIDLATLARMRREQGNPLTAREIVAIVWEAAAALDYLHSVGHLVHRDVKPANIMIKGGHGKLVDFGLAVWNEATIARATCAGTPSYMPPGVLLHGTCSRYDDQWSLAATAFFLLQDRPLFPAKCWADLMKAHEDQVVPNLAPLTGPQQYVLLRALRHSERERYPSCMEFAAEFRGAFYSVEQE